MATVEFCRRSRVGDDALNRSVDLWVITIKRGGSHVANGLLGVDRPTGARRRHRRRRAILGFLNGFDDESRFDPHEQVVVNEQQGPY